MKTHLDIRPIRSQALPTRRAGAFSMMELMVALAVLSVLIIIGTMALSRVRKTMQVTQCVQNLRQIGTAALAYASDHRQVMPLSYDLVLGVNNPVATGLIDRLEPYVGGKEGWKIFYCPDAPRATPPPTLVESFTYDYQLQRAPRPFREIGYYWLVATCNQWRPDRTLPAITTIGSGTRIIATCPHFGGGMVHDRVYQTLLMNGAVVARKADQSGHFIAYIYDRDTANGIEALTLDVSYPHY